MYLKMFKDFTRQDLANLIDMFVSEGDYGAAKDFRVLLEAFDRCSENPETDTMEEAFGPGGRE